jgi:hypothetical protein
MKDASIVYVDGKWVVQCGNLSKVLDTLHQAEQWILDISDAGGFGLYLTIHRGDSAEQLSIFA